jgi:hypothetical protein
MIVDRTRLRRSPGVREDGSEETSRPLPALHVTNGDMTVPGLQGTGMAERIMPWRDVLHDGRSSVSTSASPTSAISAS